MTTGQGGDLPAALAEIVADFQALSERDRLQLLLEFSHQLPNPPERLLGVNCKMEPVTECQSPLFLMVELDRPDDPGTPVRLFFDAPAEAPTTRGFAEILRAGLDGLPAGEVLAVPDDVPSRLGLTAAVSPLRLNGMSGMLARIKRQIRDKGSVPAPRAGATAPAAGAKAAGG